MTQRNLEIPHLGRISPLPNHLLNVLRLVFTQPTIFLARPTLAVAVLTLVLGSNDLPCYQ